MYKISAILLAAGFSRRAGKDNKLVFPINDKPMLQHAIDLLDSLPAPSSSSKIEKIVVSTFDVLGHVKTSKDMKVMLNKSPEIGQSESIKIGLRAAKGNAYLFMVADQPLLTLRDIKPLLIAAVINKDKIVYPMVDGRPSAPTIFPGRFRKDLLALSGDMGGREIRNKNPKVCFTVDVKKPDNFIEINSMVDYYNLFSEDNKI
jgi:molybdenum cofactor cytidylyltransferase